MFTKVRVVAGVVESEAKSFDQVFWLELFQIDSNLDNDRLSDIVQIELFSFLRLNPQMFWTNRTFELDSGELEYVVLIKGSLDKFVDKFKRYLNIYNLSVLDTTIRFVLNYQEIKNVLNRYKT